MAEIRSLVDEPAPQAVSAYYQGMRPFFHPVLRLEDLPEGKPVGLELLGEPVVLVRLNGQIAAFQDLCRHYQARLSQGEVVHRGETDCLVCPYHGWHYAPDGRVVAIPQLAEGREISAEARIPAYRVQQAHGLIWVCMEVQPRFPIPDFPELADPSFHAGPLRVYEPWKASLPRIIMGALDDTHFPWVHQGLLGSRETPAPPDHKVWREEHVLKVNYSIDQPRNLSTGGRSEMPSGEVDRIHYENSVAMPGVIRLVKTGQDGQVYAIWLAACPNRYNQTTTFWRVVRNYDRDPARDVIYEEFEDRVRAQDQRVVETQRPWLLPPFWTRVEMPLRPADLPLIEYQKWLQELGVGIEL